MFATAEGRVIRGEVYFRVGSPAQDAKVEVFDPAGGKLGETTTDAEGKFTLEARFHCDHRLVANAGEGHGAAYVLPAAELPDDLPPRPAAVGSVGRSPTEREPEPAPAGGTSSHPTPADQAQLKALIESAVGRQVEPLRRQIEQYEGRVRLHDILGGIGYIVGVTGLWFYLFGKRRNSGPGVY